MGVGCQIGFCAFWSCVAAAACRHPAAARSNLMGGPRYSFSFVTKREAEKSRYFRGARLAAHNERHHPAELARSCASKPHWGFDCFATAQSRLKGNGSRVARAALRAVSLKNPRADGLAPARGQHSTVGWFVISNLCCLFPVGCRGRRPRRPGDCAGLRFWVLDGVYGCSVGRGLDPSWQLRGCAWLHGRIWNPPLR